MCNEKIISDLQSTPTALNLGVLSKSLASDDDQHISECETGTTGTHKLSGSVRSLLREVREVKHSFFLSGAALKGDHPDHWSRASMVQVPDLQRAASFILA